MDLFAKVLEASWLSIPSGHQDGVCTHTRAHTGAVGQCWDPVHELSLQPQKQ